MGSTDTHTHTHTHLLTDTHMRVHIQTQHLLGDENKHREIHITFLKRSSCLHTLTGKAKMTSEKSDQFYYKRGNLSIINWLIQRDIYGPLLYSTSVYLFLVI